MGQCREGQFRVGTLGEEVSEAEATLAGAVGRDPGREKWSQHNEGCCPKLGGSGSDSNQGFSGDPGALWEQEAGRGCKVPGTPTPWI